MGKLASPAAFARAISLQRANARAKSCRSAEAAGHCDDDKCAAPAVGSQLSKRIDVMLMNISSSRSAMQTQGVEELDHDYYDGSASCSAMKIKSLSQDMQFTDFKPCFSSLSERIDRGLDLWDREFSSMSSYASDQDSFLCGLQRRLDSFGSSQLILGSKGKREDSSSSNSWSEASFVEGMMQADVQASYGGNGSECRIEPKSHWGNEGCNSDDMQRDFITRSREDPTDNLVRDNKLAPITSVINGGTQLHHDDLVQAHTYSTRKGCDSVSAIEEEGIGIIDFNTGTGKGYDRKGEAGRAGNTSCQWRCLAVDDTSGSYCSDKVAGRPESMLMKEMLDETAAGTLAAQCSRTTAELPVNSMAVEKVSMNPEEDFSESMYEMMIDKGDVEEDMEDLLNCYLLLNPVELHQVIREAFSRVWIDIIMTIR